MFAQTVVNIVLRKASILLDLLLYVFTVIMLILFSSNLCFLSAVRVAREKQPCALLWVRERLRR